MKKYILTEAELRVLLQNTKYLEALHAYGVYNWDWYKKAIHDEDYNVTDKDFAEYSEYLEEQIKPQLGLQRELELASQQERDFLIRQNTIRQTNSFSDVTGIK